MPRYHFNIYNGLDLPDREGVELANLQEARLEAVRSVGQMIEDDPLRIATGHEWHMDVTDHLGLLLFRLDVSLMNVVKDVGQSDQVEGTARS